MLQLYQGLKCNFKVVGTVKKSLTPVKICGPISVLQWAICISSHSK